MINDDIHLKFLVRVVVLLSAIVIANLPIVFEHVVHHQTALRILSKKIF